MPISETGDTLPSYGDALNGFAQMHGIGEDKADAVAAFHAVRNMPYFSGSDRTPLGALRRGRGACTAKHMILRDLLRRMGWDAHVEFVAGDFAAAVPVVETMPVDLKATVQTGGIKDIHCWVKLKDGDNIWLLDATWPDAMETYGFPVNRDWAGGRHTSPAVDGRVVQGASEDVLARKEELLTELTEAEAEERRTFLKRLSAWLESLPESSEGGAR